MPVLPAPVIERVLMDQSINLLQDKVTEYLKRTQRKSDAMRYERIRSNIPVRGFFVSKAGTDSTAGGVRFSYREARVPSTAHQQIGPIEFRRCRPSELQLSSKPGTSTTGHAGAMGPKPRATRTTCAGADLVDPADP